MNNGPIVTVEQGLEINEWLKEREKQTRGHIKSLENNLRQATASRDYWQSKFYELKANHLILRQQYGVIKCRRRLIPVVKFLLKV